MSFGSLGCLGGLGCAFNNFGLGCLCYLDGFILDGKCILVCLGINMMMRVYSDDLIVVGSVSVDNCGCHEIHFLIELLGLGKFLLLLVELTFRFVSVLLCRRRLSSSRHRRCRRSTIQVRLHLEPIQLGNDFLFRLDEIIHLVGGGDDNIVCDQ